MTPEQFKRDLIEFLAMETAYQAGWRMNDNDKWFHPNTSFTFDTAEQALAFSGVVNFD